MLIHIQIYIYMYRLLSLEGYVYVYIDTHTYTYIHIFFKKQYVLPHLGGGPQPFLATGSPGLSEESRAERRAQGGHLARCPA